VQRAAGDVIARPVLRSNHTRLGMIEEVTANFATGGIPTGPAAVAVSARWLPASLR
jgi:hypothetical protein